MIIEREWEMPNPKTFKVNCIREFIMNNTQDLTSGLVIDPFANEHSIKSVFDRDEIKYVSNDLDTDFDTDFHLDALDFMKMYDNNSVDVVLFDPPYSVRQVKECYTKLNKTVTMLDTSTNFWSKFRKEIQRIVKVGGLVFSFGWNSNGVGDEYFEKQKILMVAHGGNHNDTICVLEKKVNEYYSKELLF